MVLPCVKFWLLKFWVFFLNFCHFYLLWTLAKEKKETFSSCALEIVWKVEMPRPLRFVLCWDKCVRSMIYYGDWILLVFHDGALAAELNVVYRWTCYTFLHSHLYYQAAILASHQISFYLWLCVCCHELLDFSRADKENPGVSFHSFFLIYF